MTITLSGIHIYPVKSLRGISLPSAPITARGLRHDRRFMLVDADNEFITQREVPQMATVATAIDGDSLRLTSAFGDSVLIPLEPRAMPTRNVRVWDSVVPAHLVSAEVDAWLSEHLGVDARLVYMPDSAQRPVSTDYAKQGEIVSFADGFPLLLANEASLAELNTRILSKGGEPVGMERFRPNLVVRGALPFAEDDWKTFHLGAACLSAVKPCTRCQITTTDQSTGEVRGVEPLHTLASFRDSPTGVRFGMNLLPVAMGSLYIGDTLTLA